MANGSTPSQFGAQKPEQFQNVAEFLREQREEERRQEERQLAEHLRRYGNVAGQGNDCQEAEEDETENDEAGDEEEGEEDDAEIQEMKAKFN